MAPPLPEAELPLKVLLLTITEATEKVDPVVPLRCQPPSLAVAELKLRVLLVTVKFAVPSKAEFAMARR